MPARDRPPSFQFYPRDWMADPAVQGMTWDQRGRYLWAICCSRLTDRPGIASEDQWRRWMAYSETDWESARPSMIVAFSLGKGDIWRQSRTVEDRREQEARHRRATAGADARWRKDKQRKDDEASQPAYARTMPANGPASASASALESKDTPHTPHTPTTARVARAAGSSKSATEPDGFAEFYAAYPIRRARRAAAKAYRAAIGRTEPATILAGAKRYRLEVEDTDPRKVAHPSTWLNGDRWLDEPIGPVESDVWIPR